MAVNIGYLLGPVVSGSANGVKSQAETWAKGLKKNGHQVEFISPWVNYDWKSFDVVHIFGYGVWLDIVSSIAARTVAKIVISPIIDTNRNFLIQKIASYCGFEALHMVSPLYCLRKIDQHIAMYYTRSKYESEYLIKSFDVSPDRIKIVPLSCRFANSSIVDVFEKENFCLHVSILSSANKNVKRLINAAVKYKFRLILAGSYGTDEFNAYIATVVSLHSNIEFRGFLSEGQLVNLYSKARVFALPSLFEGVGLVALEAAALGADVVLTNRGAPKEYYNGMAFLVDPESIDDIGNAILRVMSGETRQPELSKYIKQHNNINDQSKNLEASYHEMVDRSNYSNFL